MKKLKFIGIDVSKNTLDICVLNDKTESYVIKNNQEEITQFFEKELNTDFKNYVCIENTGKYSWLITSILPTMNCYFYVINPLHLKRSLGLIRGKNDKIDAIRIANFIRKNHQEEKEFIPKRVEIEKIQVLLSERNFKTEQCKSLKIKNKELSVLIDSDFSEKLITQNNELMKQLKTQIKELEKEIENYIKTDEHLKQLNKQLKSVPGVGDILCWTLLVKTNEFKMITEPRKLACYSGVAPFSNSSGTSVFGKNRVSNLADKSIKKLLHMGALSAIRLENDLAIYYRRKVDEGKNKMAVLNAVRNKIIHIIFALIKNQNFYQNRLVVS